MRGYEEARQASSFSSSPLPLTEAVTRQDSHLTWQLPSALPASRARTQRTQERQRQRDRQVRESRRDGDGQRHREMGGRESDNSIRMGTFCARLIPSLHPNRVPLSSPTLAHLGQSHFCNELLRQHFVSTPGALVSESAHTHTHTHTCARARE
jgi:hypothetical protein